MRLPVRAPFHLEATVRVLQRRPSNLIDRWMEHRYRRAILVGDEPALIEVSNRGSIDAPDLRLSIVCADDVGRAASARQRTEAIRIASAILGLAVDASAAQHYAESYPALRATAIALRGLRPPRYPDLFETFVNVIPFQQLSLQAGMAVVTKLVGRFGQAFALAGDLCHLFPRAEVIAAARQTSLERCGLSRHKAEALHAAARAIASGTLSAATLERLPSPEALRYLQQLPGIGPWSAALILLRGFGRTDVFPQADSGAQNSLTALLRLRSASSLAPIVDRFGAYRGFLYFYGLASRLLAAGLIPPAATGPAKR